MAKKRKPVKYADIDVEEEFFEEKESCEELCEEKAEDECELEAIDECEDDDDPELCEEEYIDECVPRKMEECVSECEYSRRGIDGNGFVNHVLTKQQLTTRVGKAIDGAIKEIAPKSFVDKDPNVLVKPMVGRIKEKLSDQMIEYRLGEMDIKKKTEQTDPLVTTTRYTQEFIIPYKTPSGRNASLVAYLHVTAYFHESQRTGKNEINAYKSIMPETTARRTR